MKFLLHILLAISYLSVSLTISQINKKQLIINSIFLFFLSLSISFAIARETQALMVFALSWGLWQVLFNSFFLLICRRSHGKTNSRDKKDLYWGIFFMVNIAFTITSLVIK